MSGSNAQKGVSFGDGRQHFGRSIPILNVGPVNDKADQQSNRVGDDMALAPLDPFSGIIAANPSAFSGFHALTVNHPRCRTGLAPHPLTRHGDQIVVDFTEQSAAAPVIKIAPHC